jgi:hypothetical protein
MSSTKKNPYNELKISKPKQANIAIGDVSAIDAKDVNLTKC